MKIFLTGAPGWVGAAVVRDLLAHGHDVTGLARSPEKAKRLSDLGAIIVTGTIEDEVLIRDAAGRADAVIHTAFNHDFSKFVENAAVDARAIAAMGEALAGSDRPLIVTSGLSRLAPPDRDAVESDRPDPNGPRQSEVAARALAERGVRVSVMRLAPTVHGVGEHAFVSLLIGMARESGVAAYPGEGLNRWAAVHCDDAATLYRLAVEQGAPKPVYHAVAEDGIAMRDIMLAVGASLGLPVESRPDAYFGWFAMFARASMAASSEATRMDTGWSPSGPSLLTDLGNPAYYTAA